MDSGSWDERKHSRVLTERAKSQSIASSMFPTSRRKKPHLTFPIGCSDFKAKYVTHYSSVASKNQRGSYLRQRAKDLPIALENLAGQDLTELEDKAAATAKEIKKQAKAEAKRKMAEAASEKKEKEKRDVTTAVPSANGVVVITTTNSGQATPEKKAAEGVLSDKEGDDEKDIGGIVMQSVDGNMGSGGTVAEDSEEKDDGVVGALDEGPIVGGDNDGGSSISSDSDPESDVDFEDEDFSEEDSVILGIRVYTNNAAPASVGGQLRRGKEGDFAGLALSDALHQTD